MEIDLQSEEPENDLQPDEKTADPQQLEVVLNQGMAFLNTLSQMATGKPLVESGEKSAVSFDKETGEVVFRFKLPGN